MNAPTDVVVLVIEDSNDVRRGLEIVLGRAGFRVVSAAAGREGLRLLHEHRPGAVVLDLGLPDIDGWEVLERIRDMSDVPILVLTAQSDENARVRGLRGGADDYVVKPFGSEELVARIEALLRRRVDTTSRVDHYDDGVLSIDFNARRVRVHDTELRLTPVEFRLLATLARNAGQVLSPEQLLVEAWGDHTAIGPDRVKFAVMRLRRKLDEPGDHSCPIETVRGFGYRFSARVETEAHS